MSCFPVKSRPCSCSLAPEDLRGSRKSILSRSPDGSGIGACYMYGLRAKGFLNRNSFNVHSKSKKQVQRRLPLSKCQERGMERVMTCPRSHGACGRSAAQTQVVRLQSPLCPLHTCPLCFWGPCSCGGGEIPPSLGSYGWSNE